MNEKESTEAVPASEEVTATMEESQEQEKAARQVPLEALEAERRKRQDAEANFRAYQELIKQRDAAGEAKGSAQEEEEDAEELVNKRDLRNFKQNLTKEEFHTLKREISEDTFKETNPAAIKQINSNLKQILERKPWLASSIETAPNRYARAYEIVQDYAPQVAETKVGSDNAKRIIENSKKPGSPVAAAKSQQLSGGDYLKSIAGTSEFKEYRKKLLGR